MHLRLSILSAFILICFAHVTVLVRASDYNLTGDNGKPGADGQDVVDAQTGDFIIDKVTIRGGNGGGLSYYGIIVGSGGNASLSVSGSMTASDVTITGGASKGGGTGGNAFLDVGGDMNAGDVILRDGNDHDPLIPYGDIFNIASGGVFLNVGRDMFADNVTLIGGFGGSPSSSSPYDTNGDIGGDIVLSVVRDIIANNFTLTGGHGGNSWGGSTDFNRDGSIGGNGGISSLRVGGSMTVSNVILTGGNGGHGSGDGAIGGGGGVASLRVDGNIAARDINLIGGNGSRGGGGYYYDDGNGEGIIGGSGGDTSLSVGGDITAEGITLTAGNGSYGDSDDGFDATGGNGGDASLSVDGNITASDVVLAGGNGDYGNSYDWYERTDGIDAIGGDGGCVSLSVGKDMIAGNVILAGGNGGAGFDNNENVISFGSAAGGSGGKTTLNIGGYMAASDIYLTGGDGSYGGNVNGDYYGSHGNKGGNGGDSFLSVGKDMTASDIILTSGNGGNGNDYNSEGGFGGETSLSVGGDLTAEDIILTAGNGGYGDSDDGYGGFGGNGGDSSLSVGGNMIVNDVSLAGGNGGDGNGRSVDNYYGGSGGYGGQVSLSVDGDMIANNIILTGGNGGNGEDRNYMGFFGGSGGGVYLSVSGNMTANDITLIGGNDGVNRNGNAATYGKNAYLSIGGDVNANRVTLISGSGNDSGDYDDKAVYFNARSLSAPAIKLTRQSGRLDFTVHTLNVFQNTTLELNGTVAGDYSLSTGVAINGLAFTGGTSLAVTQCNGGSMTFGGNLFVMGTGNILNSLIGFTASSMQFDLTNVSSGSTMLSGAGTVDITGASISLLGTSKLSTGWSGTLLANTTGILSQSTVQSGRHLFTLSGGEGMALIASIPLMPDGSPQPLPSFNDTQNDLLNTSDGNNANLNSGSQYLDWLVSSESGIDSSLAKQIEAAWTDAFNLGGRNAALAIQQFQGGYSAYANMGHSITTGRFNQLLAGRNTAFFGSSIFTSLSNTGFASANALASPLYTAKGIVPAGRSRVWAQGFGSWAKQDAADNLAGYKYNSQGMALGYEYSFNNCLTFGLAAAYSRGNLKVSDLLYESDSDIMNFSLYGVYAHPSGLYAQGSFGYAHAWNDYGVNMILGGRKEGEYDSNNWSANLELGYTAKLPHDFNLIPSVGLEYAHRRNAGWNERISGNPTLVANRFDGNRDNCLDIPLGIRTNKLFRIGSNGGYIIPEVRASYVYQATKARSSANAGFAGAPGSAPMQGVDPGNNHWRFGVGVSGRFNKRVDFRLDYDFDTRSGFRGHNLTATIGLSF